MFENNYTAMVTQSLLHRASEALSSNETQDTSSPAQDSFRGACLLSNHTGITRGLILLLAPACSRQRTLPV